jgi:hypothetical protein
LFFNTFFFINRHNLSIKFKFGAYVGNHTISILRSAIKSFERLRSRFVLESFETALHGKKQTRFKEKTFDGRIEAQVIALRCSDTPAGYQKWSLRLLAETLAESGVVESISHESVRQMLKKTN